MGFARKCSLVAAVLAAFAAPLAKADTVQINDMLFGTGSSVTGRVGGGRFSGTTPTIYIGEYVGQWNGQTFYSFCVDLWKDSNFNVTPPYADYQPITPQAYFSGPRFGSAGATIASSIARLFGAHYADAQTTAVNAGAFELALWELLAETQSTFSLSSGDFRAVASSSATAISTANQWLSDLADASVGDMVLTVLDSPTHQSLITVSSSGGDTNPVPLPAGALLVASGLGLLGAAMRRRPGGMRRLRLSDSEARVA